MDKYIGRMLDNRYEILEVMGTGGMAVVYKARCHRLNRLVAIKILKSDYLEDEDFRRRFHAESQAVAMLSHPNIVSVYDVSTSLSLEADYIVMELIEGITLKQYMEKKGFLNWKETLHFAMQIAKALDHAHSRGIVHRDIKPHNVMVLKNGSVKVTDFGIARMMSKGNTLTKEALGSVHYISPEQAKGGRVDNRSDIYSLGVVMYEMMSGRPPYDGDSPVSVAIQHINGGAPMPSTLNPNIPGGLEQIIMKAMAHETAERYDSAAQMLADMDEFRKDPGILFDYNTPPTDAVITMPRPQPVVIPEVKQPPRTTAERVAGNTNPPRRTPSGSGVARNADAPQRPRTPTREQQEAQRRKREQEESRNRIAIIAIIICALVAVVAIVVFLVVWLGGSSDEPVQAVVPDLIGEDYNRLDAYPDIQIKLLEEVYDDRAPAGTIVDQDPKSGTKVEPGRMVFVTVSLGKEPKEGVMSNLDGYTQEAACEYLNRLEMGILITLEREYSDDVEEGVVIRTNPQEGASLAEGQEVVLYISLGEEIKTANMPNVIDITEEMARRTLDNQNMKLKIQVEEIFDSEIEEGYVVKTDPKTGDELKTGQTVTLYISKGAELVKMPNVVGMDVDEAMSVLEYAGFGEPEVKEVYSDKPEGEVLKQSVPKNEEVEISTVIELEISKGPEPTEPPPTEPPMVTKDVVINLQGYTGAKSCLVIVIRDGAEIFRQTVELGVDSITLYSQKGNGPQKYIVVIDETESWDYWEDFGA